MSKGSQTGSAENGVKSAVDIRWAGRTGLLLLILLGAFMLQMRDVNRPWPDDVRGWTGMLYSNVGRNYLRFGLETTKGGMVINVNPRSPEEFRFYVNHPPMVGWLTLISFKLFGYREWAERLVAIACSVGSLGLLYLILKKSVSSPEALCATVICAVLPMGLYFGSLVDPNGPIVHFFCMAVILCYARFRDNPTTGNTVLLLAVFTAAAATDWPAYYLVPILFVHYLLTTKKRNWKILLLPALSVLVFTLYICYASYLRTGVPALDIRRFLAAFRARSGMAGTDMPGGGAFTPGEWLDRVAIKWLPALYTPAALCLVCIWLIISIVRTARRRAGSRHSLFLLLLAFGLGHIVIFPQGAYIHPFWTYYLLPAVAFGTGCAFIGFARLISRGNRPITILVVLGLLGGVTAWSLANNAELEKNTQYDYASIGRQVARTTPHDAVLVTDLDQRYGFDFNIFVPIDAALIIPANLQLMHENPEKRYIFITKECGPAHFFKKKVVEALRRSRGQKGTSEIGILATMEHLDFDSVLQVQVPPPKILHQRREKDCFYLNWANTSQDRVTGYRVYFRSEKERFYTSHLNMGTVQELEFDNSGGWVESIIVVALFQDKDSDGNEVENETGFSEEITLLP